jgi:hypothetical protein
MENIDPALMDCNTFWVPHPRNAFVFVARVGEHIANPLGQINKKISCAGLVRRPANLLIRVFIDSWARFGYSGILARCCAWGLCLAAGFLPMEGAFSPLTRLVNALEGLAGTGCRLLDSSLSVGLELWISAV